jgi:hypothetical protein
LDSFEDEVAEDEGGANGDEKVGSEFMFLVVAVSVLLPRLALLLRLRLDIRARFLAGKGGGGMFVSAEDGGGCVDVRSFEGGSEA